MRYIEEFRDPKAAKALLAEIAESPLFAAADLRVAPALRSQTQLCQ